MLLSDVFLRLSLGANVTSADELISGSVRIGRDILSVFPNADIVWAARITFNGGEAYANFAAGTLIPREDAVAQVETATIVAASGCTASGDLTVTITSAYIEGFPLAVTVPLTTTAHTTAALIAAAVRTALAASTTLTAQWTVGGTGADVTLTRPLTLGGINDTTLNIAIAAACGVSAVTDSTATTAGVAGCSISRTGVSGHDIFAGDLPAAVTLCALAMCKSLPGDIECLDDDGGSRGFHLFEDDYCILSGNGIMQNGHITERLTITGTGILDLYVIAQSVADP